MTKGEAITKNCTNDCDEYSFSRGWDAASKESQAENARLKEDLEQAKAQAFWRKEFAILEEEVMELRAENASLKEELAATKRMAERYWREARAKDIEIVQLKSRQLGQFQVAVDAEIDHYGECSPCRLCNEIHGCIMKLAIGDKPGPGCPRWEGE